MTSRRARSPAVLGDVVSARLAALARTTPPPDTASARTAPARTAHSEAAHPEVAPREVTPFEEAPREGGPVDVAPPRRAVTSAALAFGREHLAALGVVGLIGLLWAAWVLFGARTTPVATAVPSSVPSAVLSEAPTPSPTPPPLLRVHVLGAVASPGVVALPAGSRVEDALAAAGGLTDAARPGELNLAAVVTDGSQIVVGDGVEPGGEIRGAEASGGGGASQGGGGAPLDLNSATAAQLETLPGVGPVTAAAILAWRTEHGRFSRIEELREVDGIGEKTYARIAPHVRV